MNDLEFLPHMYAPLQLMFAEHCIEMELKAAHRARHRRLQLSQTDFDDGTSDDSIHSDTPISLDTTESTTTNKQTSSMYKLPEVKVKNKIDDDTNKLETKDIKNANEKELSIDQQSGSSR